jgi:predicted dehydrogenase
MNPIRFGIVGVGNMGGYHANSLRDGLVAGATLAAICDTDAKQLEKCRVNQHPNVASFDSHRAMLDAHVCDAVIVATPHYDHPPIALDCFAARVHVMCEKPIAVSVNAARHLVREYEANYAARCRFGIMFQQRTLPVYRKLKELIDTGEIGPIRRFTWIVTDWFRTWTYYASGGWRATWAGEGGGVLINQCPHNLDLMQWLLGMMPVRVTAVAHVGKTHPIEVEDEVNAILEYENGATGHFVTTTGEAPGSNRLEIAGDRGRIVAEDGKLTFWRTRESVDHALRTSDKLFHVAETWRCEIPVPPDAGRNHEQVLAAFVRSIRENTPLIADGVEGVRGLEIGNAMLMSGLTRKPVDLPLDGEAFDAFLEETKQKFGGKKNVPAPVGDVDRTMQF